MSSARRDTSRWHLDRNENEKSAQENMH
jgi:hypothetical protein